MTDIDGLGPLGGRRSVRWLGGAIVVGWTGVSFLLGTVHASPGGHSTAGRLVVWAVSLLLFAVLVAGMYRRSRAAAWLPWSYAVVVVGAFALAVVAPHTPTLVLTYVAVGVATASGSVRWGLTLTLVAMAGLVAVELLHGSPVEVWSALAYPGVFLVALAARSRDAVRAAEARTEVLAERARIAREIHDILAHSLSAQIVHLEAARLLLDREDAEPAQVRERVERAQGLARAGLEETRRALATLRGDAPAADEALGALADEFQAVTGRGCDVEILGPSRDLSAQAGLAVVRTAQEALTNVRRHAPGARAVVRLRYVAESVELEVVDAGGRADPAAGGSGYGLVGMRERAELIGGTLEAGPTKEGFRVFLRVPA